MTEYLTIGCVDCEEKAEACIMLGASDVALHADATWIADDGEPRCAACYIFFCDPMGQN